MTGPDDLPLFVINLDRSPERLARFLADNAMPGLAITRLAGVDGRTIDRDGLIRAGLMAADLRHADNVLGCSLSHVACWKLVAQGDRPVVICEDDAVLRRDFVGLHRHLQTAVATADIVFWSCNLDMHVAIEMPGLGEATLMFDDAMLSSEDGIRAFQNQRSATVLYRLRRVWGAAVYTVTPQGARRLLERVLPLRNGSGDISYPTGDGRLWHMHFDSWGIDMDIGLVHVHDINGMIAVPPVALGRNDKAESNIGGQRLIAPSTEPALTAAGAP